MFLGTSRNEAESGKGNIVLTSRVSYLTTQNRVRPAASDWPALANEGRMASSSRNAPSLKHNENDKLYQSHTKYSNHSNESDD